MIDPAKMWHKLEFLQRNRLEIIMGNLVSDIIYGSQSEMFHTFAKSGLARMSGRLATGISPEP